VSQLSHAQANPVHATQNGKSAGTVGHYTDFAAIYNVGLIVTCDASLTTPTLIGRYVSLLVQQKQAPPNHNEDVSSLDPSHEVLFQFPACFSWCISILVDFFVEQRVIRACSFLCFAGACQFCVCLFLIARFK
jgi:hypothetical protein